MKRVLAATALTVVALAANAQLTTTGGTGLVFSGFNSGTFPSLVVLPNFTTGLHDAFVDTTPGIWNSYSIKTRHSDAKYRFSIIRSTSTSRIISGHATKTCNGWFFWRIRYTHSARCSNCFRPSDWCK